MVLFGKLTKRMCVYVLRLGGFCLIKNTPQKPISHIIITTILSALLFLLVVHLEDGYASMISGAQRNRAERKM